MKVRTRIGFGLVASMVVASPVQSAIAQRSNAAPLADGTMIEAITLTAENGVSARVLSYGATLQKLTLPDRTGVQADGLLGHDTASEYVAVRGFFGVTVGRFANRPAFGSARLDPGQTYRHVMVLRPAGAK